ncbi:hypothetical protein IFM89_010535 [Coptis chinensis]|uniref:DUF7875 domain-containing protein n=1 Tax=Coptis chinensis TaxID=261450 RepID=A0A835HS56_9MAGN|nr:hypothetical protein IFM89_010535 [Coptis chinensis]
MNVQQQAPNPQQQQNITRVCCLGAGTTGVLFRTKLSQRCPHLTIDIVDNDRPLITRWRNALLHHGPWPILEPGLGPILINMVLVQHRIRFRSTLMALRRLFGFSDGELCRTDAKPCLGLMSNTAGIFTFGGGWLSGIFGSMALKRQMFLFPGDILFDHFPDSQSNPSQSAGSEVGANTGAVLLTTLGSDVKLTKDVIVGMQGGHLSLVVDRFADQLFIWVMKDYGGVMES